MSTERLVDEIRDVNLSYLILAQQLIREDKVAACVRLGVSEDVADLLAKLSTSQVMSIASSNMLMCRFRFDDELVWSLLTSHTRDQSAANMHAAILMAGQATSHVDQESSFGSNLN